MPLANRRKWIAPRLEELEARNAPGGLYGANEVLISSISSTFATANGNVSIIGAAAGLYTPSGNDPATAYVQETDSAGDTPPADVETTGALTLDQWSPVNNPTSVSFQAYTSNTNTTTIGKIVAWVCTPISTTPRALPC